MEVEEEQEKWKTVKVEKEEVLAIEGRTNPQEVACYNLLHLEVKQEDVLQVKHVDVLLMLDRMSKERFVAAHVSGKLEKKCTRK